MAEQPKNTDGRNVDARVVAFVRLDAMTEERATRMRIGSASTMVSAYLPYLMYCIPLTERPRESTDSQEATHRHGGSTTSRTPDYWRHTKNLQGNRRTNRTRRRSKTCFKNTPTVLNQLAEFPGALAVAYTNCFRSF